MARRAAQVDRATRRIVADLRRVLDDVAAGRRTAGLSLRAIETATGVSKSAVDRLESYRGTTVDLAALAAVAAAVGQDLRLQIYPAVTRFETRRRSDFSIDCGFSSTPG